MRLWHTDKVSPARLEKAYLLELLTLWLKLGSSYSNLMESHW